MKVFPLALTSGGLFPTPLSLGPSSSVSLGRMLVPLNMACVFMLNWVFPAHNAFSRLTSCLVEAYLSRSCSIKCSFSVYIEQLPLLVLNFECVFFQSLDKQNMVISIVTTCSGVHELLYCCVALGFALTLSLLLLCPSPQIPTTGHYSLPFFFVVYFFSSQKRAF